MATTEERKRELLCAIVRAEMYGQTAFALLYQAQLRALDADS